jgi:hypothetical protein
VTAVRDIWADLVDKRLWPLAVVLVIALVALPLLVLKPASSAAPAPPAAVTADAGAAAPQPAALVTDPAAIAEARSGGPVDGQYKNPFAQQHVPKPKPQPKAAATAATSSAGATPVSGSGTATSGGSTGTSTPVPAAKPKPHVQVTKLKVRFGPSGGKRPVRELAPGTPVPSVNDPLLVFVDVDSHGKAEFVVASEVQPQGDGRCTPSRAICAQLFLKFGDTEFLDVTRAGGAGGTVQYQLDVLGVVKR